MLGNRVKNLAKVCVRPTRSTDYGHANLRRIRNSKLPIVRTKWPMDIHFPLETIPETPRTGWPPTSVLLGTTGGTIHDIIRSQQMECRTQRHLSKVSSIVNTYIDNDIDEDMNDIHNDQHLDNHDHASMQVDQDLQSWDREASDEEMLCPPPDYDTDAGSD